jgi:hypothetical protein
VRRTPGGDAPVFVCASTDMRRLTMGISSEKRVVRRFRHRANVYLHKPRQYSIAYYEGDSNENVKSAIKIQNTAPLSCKLTIMILMV